MLSHITRWLAHGFFQNGNDHFAAGRYEDARKDYERAVEYSDKEDPEWYRYRRALAVVFHTVGQYDKATAIYDEIINSNASDWIIASARKGRAGLSGARSSVAVRAGSNKDRKRLSDRRSESVVKVQSNSDRLSTITTGMIAHYPMIKRPLNVIWAGESHEWVDYLKRLQDHHNVPESTRVSLSNRWVGVQHVIGDEHWIFLGSSYWAHATDSQLAGVLSHELAHAEIRDTAYNGHYFIDTRQSDVAHRSNERITDLLAISKGFGPVLLDSRQYMESVGGPFRHHTDYMSPSEIAAFLGASPQR